MRCDENELLISWGQCYEHSFLPIFGEKNCVFLKKKQCCDKIFVNTSSSLGKTGLFFRQEIFAKIFFNHIIFRSQVERRRNELQIFRQLKKKTQVA
jgi:hypothetical protein